MLFIGGTLNALNFDLQYSPLVDDASLRFLISEDVLQLFKDKNTESFNDYTLFTDIQRQNLVHNLNLNPNVLNPIFDQILNVSQSSVLVNQNEELQVNIPNTFYAVSGDKVFDNYQDYALHRLDLELNRRHKRRPDLTKERIFELMNGLDGDSIRYNLWEIDNAPVPDKSNIFHHKGQDIDVTTLPEDQIFTYLLTLDETEELENLEHVRTIMQVSTPNETLHYPEPFIASPSFIHDDLHFLHILHYQFWLWFFFIFLIVFFFISFLCTVR